MDGVAGAGARDLGVPDEAPDIRDYLDLAFAGGFPEPALRLPAALRRNWYDSYLQQLLTQDAPAAEPRRDPARLRRYFEALAVNTAGVVTSRTVQDAAGIDHKTAKAYDSILKILYVVDALPPPVPYR